MFIGDVSNVMLPSMDWGSYEWSWFVEGDFIKVLKLHKAFI